MKKREKITYERLKIPFHGKKYLLQKELNSFARKHLITK